VRLGGTAAVNERAHRTLALLWLLVVGAAALWPAVRRVLG
jgi:hypothetical protein